MSIDELYDISKQFDISGNPIEISAIETGHINKTYLVTYDNGAKYILQFVNSNVFPNINELMWNIEKVTNYINIKGNNTTVTFIKTKNGNYIYNNNWRMQKYIDNTKTYTTTNDLNILKEAGKAVGDFQRQLSGFDAKTLYETIPKFHSTKDRLNDLQNAIDCKKNMQNRYERFEKAKTSIDFLTDETRAIKTDAITKILENKTIPLRVTHNDTKLSNILFNNNKYVTLIDLDTVMPGSLLYDFGDGIRSTVAILPKDYVELSETYLDMKRFEAYTIGFLEKVNNIITKEEKNLLVLGAWMMTYETAIRYLTDYLNGDTYFAINSNIKDCNLTKAKVYAEILKQIEINEEKMKGMINNYELQ